MDKCLSKLTGASTMNFVTHNERETICNKLNMSSLQGEITATYKEICSLFGKPIRHDDGKIDAVWYVEFSDGTVASIYNWKNGKAYLGETGLSVEKITDWHVGGFGKESVTLTKISLDLSREKESSNDDEKNPFESCFSIMENLKNTRGEKYATVVEVALLVMKRKQLVDMLLDLLKDQADMPSRISNILDEMDTQISVRTISSACKASGINFNNQKEADELMEWASELAKQEVMGIEGLLKKRKEK